MLRRSVQVLVLLSLTLSTIAGATSLDEIWKPSEEGWYDIDLTITSVKMENDGYLSVVAKGLFRGKEVGLKVSFAPNMKPGLLNAEVDRTAFTKNGIVYSSIGPESDKLIKAIAALYKVELPRPKFSEHIPVTSFALEEHPFDLRKDNVHFKVFFNDQGDENEYAELFTNIDIPEKRLEFHEKDEEYRRNVVRALSAP